MPKEAPIYIVGIRMPPGRPPHMVKVRALSSDRAVQKVIEAMPGLSRNDIQGAARLRDLEDIDEALQERRRFQARIRRRPGDVTVRTHVRRRGVK